MSHLASCDAHSDALRSRLMRCMRLRPSPLATSFFSSMACAHARSALTSGM